MGFMGVLRCSCVFDKGERLASPDRSQGRLERILRAHTELAGIEEQQLLCKFCSDQSALSHLRSKSLSLQ